MDSTQSLPQKIRRYHKQDSILYGVSRLFERAGFYGVRSIVIIYLIDFLNVDAMEGYKLYGWFTGSLIFSQLIGGILGDLAIGNKNSILAGGIIQALGAFAFCIPDIMAVYAGLFLISLGSGLSTPNLLANFGKTYLDHEKIMDSGFNLFYFMINVGSFMGVMAIGYFGGLKEWNTGFILSGLICLLSLVPILLIESKDEAPATQNPGLSYERKAFSFLAAIFIIGIFWTVYEMSGRKFYELQIDFGTKETLGIPGSLWSSMNSYFGLLFGILAIILWNYIQMNRWLQMGIGFIIGAIAYGLFTVMFQELSDVVGLFFFILALIGLSEILVAPIYLSVITIHANPKYLAILMAVSFIPIRAFTYIISTLIPAIFYSESGLGNSEEFNLIGIALMALCGIGMLVFYFLDSSRQRGSLA
ncbi:MAG: MFS transporter [Bacteroidia bacterium]|nr:MFS transporter [Bacteroidia bacterium]